MLLTTMLLVLFPAVVTAAQSPAVDPLGSGLRLLGALGMILGLILLLYAGSRRGLRWLPKARGGAIRIVETRPLGPKKSLCLIEVRGRELLLGIGAERVELLCQLGETAPLNFDETLQQQLGVRP